MDAEAPFSQVTGRTTRYMYMPYVLIASPIYNQHILIPDTVVITG